MMNSVNFGAAIKYSTLNQEQLETISKRFIALTLKYEGVSPTVASTGDLIVTNDNRHAFMIMAVGELQKEGVLPKEIAFNVLG